MKSKNNFTILLEFLFSFSFSEPLKSQKKQSEFGSNFLYLYSLYK
jgi:hypothetical protein